MEMKNGFLAVLKILNGSTDQEKGYFITANGVRKPRRPPKNQLTAQNNPFTGYKFNRHIYIPLNGQTVKNWEILLEFSAPVNDIEVWTVKPTQIDQDGLMWKFTSLDNQVGFQNFLIE